MGAALLDVTTLHWAKKSIPQRLKQAALEREPLDAGFPKTIEDTKNLSALKEISTNLVSRFASQLAQQLFGIVQNLLQRDLLSVAPTRPGAPLLP